MRFAAIGFSAMHSAQCTSSARERAPDAFNRSGGTRRLEQIACLAKFDDGDADTLYVDGVGWLDHLCLPQCCQCVLDPFARVAVAAPIPLPTSLVDAPDDAARDRHLH